MGSKGAGAGSNGKGKGTSTTATSAPNWLPGQEGTLTDLFQQYQSALNKGPQVLQSDRNAAMTAINNSYAPMKNSLESDLAARGFGNAPTGNLGRGFENIDISRANAQSGAEGQLQSQAYQRWLGLIGMGPSMGQAFGGTSSSGTSTPGLGNVLDTLAGSALNGAFGNVFKGFGTAAALKALGGGSAPAAAGDAGSGDSLGGGGASVGNTGGSDVPGPFSGASATAAYSSPAAYTGYGPSVPPSGISDTGGGDSSGGGGGPSNIMNEFAPPFAGQ